MQYNRRDNFGIREESIYPGRKYKFDISDPTDRDPWEFSHNSVTINDIVFPLDKNVNFATDLNDEPTAFSLGGDQAGCFGVASDSFSYWDQESDDLLAKGDGGLRQMYNYATVDHKVAIETPPDTWSPDKVGETAMKDMQEERNKDLQLQQMSKMQINR